MALDVPERLRVDETDGRVTVAVVVDVGSVSVSVWVAVLDTSLTRLNTAMQSRITV